MITLWCSPYDEFSEGVTVRDATAVYSIGPLLGADRHYLNDLGEVVDASLTGLLTVPMQLSVGDKEYLNIEQILIRNEYGPFEHPVSDLYLTMSYYRNDKRYKNTKHRKFKEIHLFATPTSPSINQFKEYLS